MNWLALLKGLLALSNSLTEYLRNKQLLEAGEAQAISEGLQNAQHAIQKAREARNTAGREFDKRDGVPDDEDPNLRD